MILALAIFGSLLATCPSFVNASTELVVLSYTGVERTELGSALNQRYAFTFCACHAPTFNPAASRDCTCSHELKGKTAMESTFKAVYSSACMHSSDSHKCLSANFDMDTSDYYYVRVTLGGEVITNPTWQQIQHSTRKTTERITTNFHSDMRMTYILLGVGLHSQTHKTTHKFYVPTTNRNRFPLAKVTKTTAIEKYKSMKTIPPVSATQMPTLSGNGIVQHLNSINQIRQFLLIEGIRRGVPASHFDVNMFKNRMVAHHNAYRARHGAAPLSYDPKLEAYAQRWADSLGNRQECLVHEKPRNYGENLFYFAANNLVNPDLFAEVVTQGFYLEGIGYNYGRYSPGTFHKYGHFTQLVWKASSRMGVGVAIRYSTGNKRGPCQPSIALPMVYVVIKYDPPGNMQAYSEYMENVTPPLFKN